MAITTTTTTTTTATNATGAISGNAELQKIKKDLAAALVAAGVTDAKPTDTYPKGFPITVDAKGRVQNATTWTEAYKMVTKRVEDSNPSTPGTLVIDSTLLANNLKATKTLAAMGVTSLSSFAKGISATGAIDALYKDTSNGKLATVLAQSGIYDTQAFPDGTNAFAAFKLIEDPNEPGKVSLDRYKEYQAASSALKSMDITTLVNFPRGTTMVEAKAMLEPKADLMLKMVGVDKSYFKDSSISSLTAITTLMHLPDSIREMKALPTGMTSADLAKQATAAKKLVAMGYDSLTPFAAMKSFAKEKAKPVTALGVVQKLPAPDDLPGPTSTSTERLFTATPKSVKRSYGMPNPVKSTIYTALPSEKVTSNPIPNFRVVTAAEVIAFNKVFWPIRPISGAN
ncbi:MAG: hypothetical protein RL404_1384 [Pseudomonadota bacterium]